MKAKRLRKRQGWYEAGLRAAKSLSPKLNSYFCPICLTGVAKENLDLLSFEHVPPKAAGGRELVLTCRSCNSTSGHALDAHVSRMRKVTAFIRGTSPAPGDVQLTINGTTVRAVAHGQGLFTFAPNRNDPKAVAAATEALEKAAKDGAPWTFDVTYRTKVSDEAVKRSYARAAYLALFALWGYHYILRSDVSETRRMIHEPREGDRFFTLANPSRLDEDSFMFLVQEPQWMRGAVAVNMNGWTVFLPGVPNPAWKTTFESGAPQSGAQIHFSGRKLRWPVGPEFLMDLSDEVGASQGDHGDIAP